MTSFEDDLTRKLLAAIYQTNKRDQNLRNQDNYSPEEIKDAIRRGNHTSLFEDLSSNDSASNIKNKINTPPESKEANNSDLKLRIIKKNTLSSIGIMIILTVAIGISWQLGQTYSLIIQSLLEISNKPVNISINLPSNHGLPYVD